MEGGKILQDTQILVVGKLLPPTLHFNLIFGSSLRISAMDFCWWDLAGGIWPRYQTRHLLLHFFSSSQILSNSCLQMEQQLWELSPQTSSSQAPCESCNEPDGSFFRTCTILASRGRGSACTVHFNLKALMSLTFYFSSVHSLHLPESDMRFFYCFVSRVQQVVVQKRWHRIFQYGCSCSQKELLQHWKNQYESSTHQLNAVQRMGWFRRWYASLVDELKLLSKFQDPKRNWNLIKHF